MLERDIDKVELSIPYRVICISDIHGNVATLKKLLAKINYDKEKDYLFILGDLFEHGGDDTAPTLDYLYELSKYERVHIISGNHERRIGYMLYRFNFQQISEWINNSLWYRKEPLKPLNILTQWAETIGFKEITEENYKDVITAIKEKYKDKCDFILNLPLVIETEEFICVHSGLESREDWWETTILNAWSMNTDENKTGKWIISGHAPVYLFSESGLTYLPIIRNSNKTINIDGGSTIIWGGQINAFIIEKAGENEDIVFSYDYADIFPQGVIIKNIEAEYNGDIPHKMMGNATVIKKGEYFTECEVAETGKTVLVKNEKVSGEIFDCWRQANFISVYENEIVSVIDNSCEGYAYVKNPKGELGWIPKECLKIEI
jgi:protein phosphatase